MKPREIILRPIITEKTTFMQERENTVCFEVDRRANKIQVRNAVEELFDVKVVGVSTMNPPRRTRRVGRFAGRRAQVKKAVVRLAEGNAIQLFPES